MTEDGETRKSLRNRKQSCDSLEPGHTLGINPFSLSKSDSTYSKIERGDRKANRPHLRTGRETVSQLLPTEKDPAVLQRPGGDHGLSWAYTCIICM